MNKSDKITRMAAFYFSVALFLVLFPIILSYALGYQIDYHTFKIYKTGILYINSRPAGASIYINGRCHADFTPAEIEEMKPGTYRIEVRREGFYPWEKEMVIKPNMVTRADRIVLFPAAQSINIINKRPISDFVISNRNNLYYFTKHGLFRSSIDGNSLKRLSSYSAWPQKITCRKFSPDSDKFLYSDGKKIFVIYLDLDRTLAPGAETVRVDEILTVEDSIIDMFWHSASGYFLVVTEKDIKVVELRGGAGRRNIVLLYKFNSCPKNLYYDKDNDSLYFTDTKPGTGSQDDNYLYRLDLRQKFFDSILQLLVRKEPESGYEKR